MIDFHLTGLRADNPLAFLAALGTLRVAAAAFGSGAVQLRWLPATSAWRPILRVTALGGDASEERVNEDELVMRLHQAMSQSSGRQAFAIADDLTLGTTEFRAASLRATAGASARDRSFTDFMAAFGSDAVERRENGKSTGKIADTAFRTMSGAGHQHFLGFMRALADDVGPEHLRRSLFAQWRYDDSLESHTMRWDPVDDVRYALRWRDSSGDPERKRAGTMWGANRLAIEALPLLPTMPTQQAELSTVGFSSFTGAGVAWTWPVWCGWSSVDTTRSLLALSELQKPQPDRKLLGRMGVGEVFRCYRITQGKYRNFTLAWAV